MQPEHSREAALLPLRGRAVRVRPVLAVDAGRLATLLMRLSPRSAQGRYLAARAFSPEAAREEAARIATGRTDRHVALVAEASFFGDDEIVGVAELIRLDEEEGLGELAITVRDDMQGAGIGLLLAWALADKAARLGLSTLHIDLLAGNTAMRRIAEHLGPPTTTWLGAGVLQLRVDLDTPQPTTDTCSVAPQRRAA